MKSWIKITPLIIHISIEKSCRKRQQFSLGVVGIVSLNV